MTDRTPTQASPEREPAFAAPWEATAFALKAHLVATGRIDAARFAALYGAALREPIDPPPSGTSDYVAFATALEQALGDLADPDALRALQEAWREAAAATPHGEPIQLTRSPTPSG